MCAQMQSKSLVAQCSAAARLNDPPLSLHVSCLHVSCLHVSALSLPVTPHGDDSTPSRDSFEPGQGRAGDFQGSSGGRMGDESHATSCYKKNITQSNTTTCQTSPSPRIIFASPFPLRCCRGSSPKLRNEPIFCIHSRSFMAQPQKSSRRPPKTEILAVPKPATSSYC